MFTKNVLAETAARPFRCSLFKTIGSPCFLTRWIYLICQDHQKCSSEARGKLDSTVRALEQSLLYQERDLLLKTKPRPAPLLVLLRENRFAERRCRLDIYVLVSLSSSIPINLCRNLYRSAYYYLPEPAATQAILNSFLLTTHL